ncbi:MAG: hypothetical protein Q4E33_05140 [Erysipelotrichaceae bacterium]|nr:hypothetical protein [Erysipelotrichaceae bacterium]
MAKSKYEINELKQEYKALITKLKELTEEELQVVVGGVSAFQAAQTGSVGSGGGGEKTAGGTSGSPTPGSEPGNIFARATSLIGKPFKKGAVGPDAFDASGLVSYCITGTTNRVGTELTFMGWSRVSIPVPGNICVNSNHCGIYAGGGQMIHAPGFGQAVCYGPVQTEMIYVKY